MGLLGRKRQKKIREYVIERDGSACIYCDRELTDDSITMEHIVPSSKRGTYNTTNLTVSCAPCNKIRGNQPFFEYCRKFNFPLDKILKFERLYFNNLKIKVLNIAKEECLKEPQRIPNELLQEACSILRIKRINFDSYPFGIDMHRPIDRRRIKYSFEKIIKDIEADSR